MGQLSHPAATAITNAQLGIMIYLNIHTVFNITESKKTQVLVGTHHTHHYFTEIRNAENKPVWNYESVQLLGSLNGSLIWDYIYTE